MCGAVLNTLNTRLDAAAIAFMLDHGEAKALIVDREFSGVIAAALKLCKARPLIVDYDDPEYDGDGAALGGLDYEALLAEGDPEYAWVRPRDEWDAISLNYTSGTTGDPKGSSTTIAAPTCSRSGNVVTADMGRHPVYLWTLPMFIARLVLSVVDQRQGGRPHLPAPGARQGDVRPDRRAPRHPPLRRADRHVGSAHARPEEKRPLPHVVRFFTAASPCPRSLSPSMSRSRHQRKAVSVLPVPVGAGSARSRRGR